MILPQELRVLVNLTRKGSYREELWRLFYHLEQSWCNASALTTSSKINAAGAEMIYFIVGCLSDRHQFLGLIVSLRLLSEKELNLGSNILTNVWLNELFHTESLTLFFSVHLLFGKAMLRSRNQYSGVTTLQGISNKSTIQGSIYLVSPLFYGLCQRVSWASLWSVVRFLEYFFNYGVFCLPFLPLRLHHVYN